MDVVATVWDGRVSKTMACDVSDGWRATGANSSRRSGDGAVATTSQREKKQFLLDIQKPLPGLRCRGTMDTDEPEDAPATSSGPERKKHLRQPSAGNTLLHFPQEHTISLSELKIVKLVA